MKRRTTFKVAFFIKRAAMKKSGKMPIIARIAIDNQVAQFSTKLEIEEHLWSVERGAAIGNTAKCREINQLLERTKATLINIYHERRQLGCELTAERLKSLFFGTDDSQESLLEAFARNNDAMYRMIGKDVTLSTYNKYELAKRRISEYLRHNYNLSDIAMRDVNLNFIKEYEIFLRTNCNLSHNVAAKMITFLKRIVNAAFNNGSISANPFASYKIKMQKVDRGFLTREELNVIMQKKIEINRLAQVRDIFVFCCWTGLSYIDVKQLTVNNIRRTDSGELWIDTKREKTDNKVDVLLLDVPLRILERYRGKVDDGRVLPVMSNQKCNSYLKELSDICLIDKNLTFHMSRHTFATTITLTNGVPIETVSKMLGHSNLKTTQIYARITTEKIGYDMQKLAEKLSDFKTKNIG
ncbi:MAG: site-specific integrase [Rikenellaceae bacterium]